MESLPLPTKQSKIKHYFNTKKRLAKQIDKKKEIVNQAKEILRNSSLNE